MFQHTNLASILVNKKKAQKNTKDVAWRNAKKKWKYKFCQHLEMIHMPFSWFQLRKKKLPAFGDSSCALLLISIKCSRRNTNIFGLFKLLNIWILYKTYKKMIVKIATYSHKSKNMFEYSNLAKIYANIPTFHKIK